MLHLKSNFVIEALFEVCNFNITQYATVFMYVVGSKSFRPDVRKPRQMENAVRDI